MSGRALVCLAVAGVIVGLAALALVLSGEHRPVPWELALTLGWGFIGAGLYGWWRRPDNRTGALMTLAGFLWFLGAFQSSETAWVFTLGLAVQSLWLGALIHMLVAFPSGRVAPGLERALVWLAWLGGALLTPLTLLFTADPESCADCPENVLLVREDETAAAIVQLLVGGVAAAMLAALSLILIRRWRSFGPVQRRALTPVLWNGAAIAALAVLTLTLIGVGADRLSRVVDTVLLLGTIAVPFAFLAGLMRASVSRAGTVSALLERLGGGGTRDALAAALGDDTLALAYWLPDQGRFVDAAGQTVRLPSDGGRAVTEIERDGAPVAAIVHDPTLLEDRELVRTAGAAAALALENERLAAEVRARYDDLQASSARLVAAGDAARRRIERDLHDGAQQRLVSLSVTLNLARKQVEPGSKLATLLDSAVAELTAGLAELRELARGIHPAVLTERGLEPALEGLAARSPVTVELRHEVGERLPGAVEAAAYFVVMEALTNVAKYASAETAEVTVREGAGEVLVEVRDDGVGGADPRAGSGLAGLADRVAALGGRLGVESPPGGGTVVRAVLPARRSQRAT